MDGVKWSRVRRAWDRATQLAALEPIETSVIHVECHGISFIVRRVESLKRKAQAGSVGTDPFAPPHDPALLVGDVSPTHVALLNRFPVLSEHVLLVTREFRDQQELLTEEDFAAMAAVMGEYPTLGFYNGGTEAGASQSHKHLQVVPLPLASSTGERVPLEPHLGGLPFLHSYVSLAAPRDITPAMLSERYKRLWRACGFDPSGARQPVPYNLLLTESHMWLVPRRCESFEGIEVNGLGFAGAMLAKDAGQMKRIEELGPLSVLREVALEGIGHGLSAG